MTGRLVHFVTGGGSADRLRLRRRAERRAWSGVGAGPCAGGSDAGTGPGGPSVVPVRSALHERAHPSRPVNGAPEKPTLDGLEPTWIDRWEREATHRFERG